VAEIPVNKIKQRRINISSKTREVGPIPEVLLLARGGFFSTWFYFLGRAEIKF
jgi:hypothetical protein